MNLSKCNTKIFFLLILTHENLLINNKHWSISTDFDVHRNWLSITYNLPIKQWFFDTTSQWTLDYPPLFAFFEYLLAFIASFFLDQSDLRLCSSPVRNKNIKLFQKISVIVCDSIYYYAVYQTCNALQVSLDKSTNEQIQNPKTGNNKQAKKIKNGDEIAVRRQDLIEVFSKPQNSSTVALLLLFQPGLIIIDHIHFQYNGLLSGFFLMSIAEVVRNRHVHATIWFSLLLNLKHIYLYAAPAYGVYIFTNYCIGRKLSFTRMLINFLKLVTIIVTIFSCIFGFFLDLKTINQIFIRLFPFKRGLTHAYWAPNFWAIYNTVDRALNLYYSNTSYGTIPSSNYSQTSTSGLVQDIKHIHLPNIQPLTTFTLVICFISPILVKLFIKGRDARQSMFIRAVALTCLTSFMFGWHVHEKAILMTLIPLCPVCILVPKLKNTFLRITLSGTYSLFPLLIEPAEYTTKVCLLLTYYFYCKLNLLDSEYERKANHPKTIKSKIATSLDNLYFIGFILIEIFLATLPWYRLNKYEFLPLLLVSTYSAIGISYSYLEMYVNFLRY